MLALARCYCISHKEMPLITDSSPKGRSTDLLEADSQEITPVRFFLSQDDPEEEKMAQPSSQKRGSYVPHSARVLRSQVTPPPCIKNPYNMDPRIDDNVFCVRKCKSSGNIYALHVIETCSFHIPSKYVYIFVYIF